MYSPESGAGSRLSLSVAARDGADNFLLLQIINSPIKGNLGSITSAFVVILASMGCCTSKNTSAIEKKSTGRISLERDRESLEYKKEQFNTQMKKEKELMKRAQWKSEAEIKISREKSDKERKTFGFEKKVQIARAKAISNRETAMEKREFMAGKREDAVQKREEKVKEGFAEQRKAEEKMEEEKEKMKQEWSGIETNRKQLLQAFRYAEEESDNNEVEEEIDEGKVKCGCIAWLHLL